jgi:hypothetical protein
MGRPTTTAALSEVSSRHRLKALAQRAMALASMTLTLFMHCVVDLFIFNSFLFNILIIIVPKKIYGFDPIYASEK